MGTPYRKGGGVKKTGRHYLLEGHKRKKHMKQEKVEQELEQEQEKQER